MSSFDHKVVPLDGHIRAGYFRGPFGSRDKCRAGVNRRRENPGCQNDIEFVCSYAYVTGRAGRVSTSEKGRCREHAQMFANQHQVPGPDELEGA